ncbi:hypothetical protein C0J52_27455 [Blattella germanica]|nr:hypothetical protein C0J52_27455 [Blattella germanica]
MKKTTNQTEVADESVEIVREAFVRSPQKSTTRRNRGLGIPQQKVWKILRLLNFKLSRIQLLQHSKAEDYGRHL